MPTISVAVVFHGRLGVWHATASRILVGGNHALFDANFEVSPGKHKWRTMRQAEQLSTASKGFDLPGQPHSTVKGFVRFFSQTFVDRVLKPTRRAGGATVEIFLHSWHPELATELDHRFAATASLHEALPAALTAERVESQHTSMLRGLQLALAHPHRTSRPSHTKPTTGFTHVLVSRYDVLWLAPLRLSKLLLASSEVMTSSRRRHAPPPAPPLLWLPRWCHRAPVATQEQAAAIRSACGFQSVYQGDAYLARRPECKGWVCHEVGGTRLNTALVLDWWFAATPSVALAFAKIATRIHEYRQALRLPTPYDWSHFYWHHIVHSVLGIANRTRYTLYEGVDFTIARQWRLGAPCQRQ